MFYSRIAARRWDEEETEHKRKCGDERLGIRQKRHRQSLYFWQEVGVDGKDETQEAILELLHHSIGSCVWTFITKLC